MHGHRDERRRKFHEGLLKMLYPPPPPAPSQEEDGDKPLGISLEGLDEVDHVTDWDDLEETAASESDDDEECVPQKLTRAQRKRLRQKKMKETASLRRKIIGPQLPSPGGGVIEDKTSEIPYNAADKFDGAMGKPDNTPTCRNQKKLKQRRIAKRLAREREKGGNQDGFPSVTDGRSST